MFGLLNIDKPAGHDLARRGQSRAAAGAGRTRSGTRARSIRWRPACWWSPSARRRGWSNTCSGCRRRIRRRFCSAGRAIRRISKARSSSCRVAASSDAGEIEAALPRFHRHDPAAAAGVFGAEGRRPAGVRPGPPRRGGGAGAAAGGDSRDRDCALRLSGAGAADSLRQRHVCPFARPRSWRESLGTGAVMSALRRLAVGPFRAEEGLQVDQLSVGADRGAAGSAEPGDSRFAAGGGRWRRGGSIEARGSRLSIGLASAARRWRRWMGQGRLVAILLPAGRLELRPAKCFLM